MIYFSFNFLVSITLYRWVSYIYFWQFPFTFLVVSPYFWLSLSPPFPLVLLSHLFLRWIPPQIFFSYFSFGEAGGIYLASTLSISVVSFVKICTTTNNNIYNYHYRPKKKYKLLTLISNKPKKIYKNGHPSALDRCPKKKNDSFCWTKKEEISRIYNM